MSKLLYVGAGLDFRCTQAFDVKNFIFIDQAPLTDRLGKYIDSHFIERLISTAKKFGFYPCSVSGNLRIFQNKSRQTVKYYTQCMLPTQFTGDIIDATDGWDMLYVAGHDPHSCIMESVSASGAMFVGVSGTVYDAGESDSVMNLAYSNDPRFTSYMYIMDRSYVDNRVSMPSDITYNKCTSYKRLMAEATYDKYEDDYYGVSEDSFY